MQRIGAHVSAAGGVENAPLNAKEEKCETFQFFVNSPQTYKFKMPTDEQVEAFKENMEVGKFKDSYVHASYLINLAALDNRVRHGSITLLKKGLEACSKLGVNGMMFHTGSAKDHPTKEEGIKKAIESLDTVLEGYSGTTKLLIENAAGAGNTIGVSFEEVGMILRGIKKKHEKKIGVCLDTQHAFASGYDWRTLEGTEQAMKEFAKYIGMRALMIVQYNDSKTECGSNKDRHEHIAIGKMGMDAAKNILGHPKLKNKPFCLETPFEGREADIKTLKSLRQK